MCSGPLAESQGQNLAVAILDVLYSLDSGGVEGERCERIPSSTLAARAVGLRVSGSGSRSRVLEFWFRVLGFGSRDAGFGLRVSDFGSRVSGFGF